jgi:uncharacterized protein YhaN
LTALNPDATILPMPDIHQLEERVLTLMEEFRRLKKDNKALSVQVDELKREIESLENESTLSQGNQERLSQLETLNSKSEKDRKDMRAKVQAIIKNLDKFDLA